MTPVLSVAEVTSFYGTSQALFGIDLQIGQGETIGLLGRNGMGKTTTIRTIVGLLAPRSGRIEFRGQPIGGLAADRIGRLGIALVPEGRQVFPNLTVEENLVAFAANRSATPQPWTLARVYALFPRLRERRSHFGFQLSGGEQQMVAIGRALMTNPHLLILDEATEGLAPLVREDIWRCIRSLRTLGMTILIVDKYVERLLELADRHLILERGNVVWQGSSGQLREQPALWHRYLGI